MGNLKPKEKRQILAEFIEKNVMHQYDIAPYMGKPLSYFDYDKVKEMIKWFDNLDK